jgi:hypothetical protein
LFFASAVVGSAGTRLDALFKETSSRAAYLERNYVLFVQNKNIFYPNILLL